LTFSSCTLTSLEDDLMTAIPAVNWYARGYDGRVGLRSWW
jgi:hypothetical protein